MSKLADLATVTGMCDLDRKYIHWFDEGGAEVEIPQYGGKPQYFTTCPFTPKGIEQLTNEAWSWT